MKRLWKKAVSLLAVCGLLAAALTLGATAEKGVFRDVPARHWAAEAIAGSVEAGLFQGHSNGTFGLGQEMSRAAFATTLTRLFQWEPISPQFSSFTDVDQTAWYYSAVETACINGAVTRQDTAFRPTDPVTREEMTVMLIRALGYDALSGLAQNLTTPFTDLTTNTGYISMAYDLGLVNGVGKASFAPDQPATREQAAVVLLRLYQKLSQGYPSVSAVSGQQGIAADRPLDTVAVSAVRLTASGGTPQLGLPLPRQEAAKLREETVARGAQALLRVSGDDASLQGNPQTAAKLLADEVKNGSWDGIQLDFIRLHADNKANFTALTTALRAALPDKLLFVTAEAPAWNGTVYGGYDFVALSQQADRLILRVAPGSELGETLPIASPEPLEEVYYALCAVSEQVDTDKLSLLLTTTGSRWIGFGSAAREDGTLTAEQIHALYRAEESHYYKRHQAAYLTLEGSTPQTVWYLDEAAVSARVRLAGFLGVNHITLSDGASVADYENYSIAAVLWDNPQVQAPLPQSPPATGAVQ